MGKFPLMFDEREMNVLRNICTIMYIITLFALMIIQLYRQFALHQPQQEWNDIALLITTNVIALLGAALYLTGAVEPNKREYGISQTVVKNSIFWLRNASSYIILRP